MRVHVDVVATFWRAAEGMRHALLARARSIHVYNNTSNLFSMFFSSFYSEAKLSIELAMIKLKQQSDWVVYDKATKGVCEIGAFFFSSDS